MMVINKPVAFTTTFNPRYKGIAVVRPTERVKLIELLENSCKTRLSKSLRLVMEEIYENNYQNRPDMLTKVKENIPNYLQGKAGIGLSFLVDIIEQLGLKCTYSVEMPGKKATLVLYDEVHVD